MSATTCAYDLATISSLLTITTLSPTFSPARLAGPPSFTSLTKIVSIGVSQKQWSFSSVSIQTHIHTCKQQPNNWESLPQKHVQTDLARLSWLLGTAAEQMLPINHTCLTRDWVSRVKRQTRHIIGHLPARIALFPGVLSTAPLTPLTYQ